MDKTDFLPENTLPVFNNAQNFELSLRIAEILSKSNMIPTQYQNNIPNTMIVLDIANKMGTSALMIMQHLNFSYGKPSWSSTFLISAINSCGRFDCLKFEFVGEKNTNSWGCHAYATNKKTNEVLKGATITIEIAKIEGWYDLTDSKWKTMPELMLQYRSAAFFSRVHCPEITMGMQTTDEVSDSSKRTPFTGRDKKEKLKGKLKEEVKTTSKIILP